MDKQLFEELRAKGFPIKIELSPETSPIKMVWRECILLEDLIQACGRKLDSLDKTDSGKWVAVQEDVQAPYGEGNTPEEAVARLWLALN